jgi:hypothetical protein
VNHEYTNLSKKHGRPRKIPRKSGPEPPPRTPHAALPARKTEAKMQLGTRIAEAKYRQLKLAAALCA